MDQLFERLASGGPLGILAVLAILAANKLYNQLVACQACRVADIERIVTILHKQLIGSLDENTAALKALKDTHEATK